MTWRTVLIDWPARGFDGLVTGYLVFLAALAILCLVTAALWGLAGLLGLPLP